MKQKAQKITFTQAIDSWYGGVKGLALQTLPFKCRCGDTTYPIVKKDKTGIKAYSETTVMAVVDCIKHIRRVHKELIKK